MSSSSGKSWKYKRPGVCACVRAMLSGSKGWATRGTLAGLGSHLGAPTFILWRPACPSGSGLPGSNFLCLANLVFNIILWRNHEEKNYVWASALWPGIVLSVSVGSMNLCSVLLSLSVCWCPLLLLWFTFFFFSMISVCSFHFSLSLSLSLFSDPLAFFFCHCLYV